MLFRMIGIIWKLSNYKYKIIVYKLIKYKNKTKHLYIQNKLSIYTNNFLSILVHHVHIKQ